MSERVEALTLAWGAPATASHGSLSRLLSLLLAALAAGCVVLSIGPWPVGVFQDDGIYMVLGKSLATGHGYRFLQMPGTPNATHYPPVYPAFLALLWKAWPQFPQNVVLFKYANAVLLALVAVGTFRFARQWGALSDSAAAVVTGLFVCCTPLVLLSVMVLSEPLFLAMLLPTLVLVERTARHARLRDALAAGVAIGLLSLVRSLGFLMTPALLAVLLARRQWKAALIVGAAAGVTVLPWQVWVAVHAHEVPSIYLGKYGSYFGWWIDAIRTEGLGWVGRVVVHNLRMLTAQGWASTATESLPLAARVATTVAVSGFFVGGLVLMFRRLPATALFVAAYLAMVVVWPFAPARFTWGIWPLVGLAFGFSVTWVWSLGRRASMGRGAAADGGPPHLEDSATHADRPHHSSPAPGISTPAFRALLLGTATALAAGYITYNVKGVTHGWWTVVQQSVADRSRPLAEWVLANTRPTDVLATDDDILIHLYTGRQTIPPVAFTAQEHLDPQTTAFAAERLHEILAAFHVDYVMASTTYGTYAVNGLITRHPPEIRLVAVLRSGAVFAPTHPLGRSP